METIDRIVATFGEQGRVTTPGFLEDRLRSTLESEIQVLSKQGALRAAAVGARSNRQVRKEIRADELHWWNTLAPSTAQRECLDRMEQLRLAFNRQLQMGLWEFECHYSRYAAGTFYRRHLDQLAGSLQRCVSCVLYLNASWTPADGGILRIYRDKKSESVFEDIVPQPGKLVLFASARFPHEVLTVQRERHSVAGWFSTRL
ncbi:MAG: 2OG-Fe(II) oxygenase [Burkholderiales bacterium]